MLTSFLFMRSQGISLLNFPNCMNFSVLFMIHSTGQERSTIANLKLEICTQMIYHKGASPPWTPLPRVVATGPHFWNGLIQNSPPAPFLSRHWALVPRVGTPSREGGWPPPRHRNLTKWRVLLTVFLKPTIRIQSVSDHEMFNCFSGYFQLKIACFKMRSPCNKQVFLQFFVHQPAVTGFGVTVNAILQSKCNFWIVGENQSIFDDFLMRNPHFSFQNYFHTGIRKFTIEFCTCIEK